MYVLRFLPKIILIDTPIDFTAGNNMFSQFFVIIVTFLFVLFLAYFSIRLMAGAKYGRFSKIKRNIKIIEAVGIGNQQTLQLIEVGGRCFLIGVSKASVTVIGEIDRSLVNIENAMMQEGIPFEKYLSKFFSKDRENVHNNTENKDDYKL